MAPPTAKVSVFTRLPSGGAVVPAWEMLSVKLVRRTSRLAPITPMSPPREIAVMDQSYDLQDPVYTLSRRFAPLRKMQSSTNSVGGWDQSEWAESWPPTASQTVENPQHIQVSIVTLARIAFPSNTVRRTATAAFSVATAPPRANCPAQSCGPSTAFERNMQSSITASAFQMNAAPPMPLDTVLSWIVERSRAKVARAAWPSTPIAPPRTALFARWQSRTTQSETSSADEITSTAPAVALRSVKPRSAAPTGSPDTARTISPPGAGSRKVTPAPAPSTSTAFPRKSTRPA